MDVGWFDRSEDADKERRSERDMFPHRHRVLGRATRKMRKRVLI